MLIVDGRRDAGDHDVMVSAEDSGLARRIARRKPDLVLIDAGNPSREVHEELALATAPMARPVAMFDDKTDGNRTRAVIEAGLSADVVEGLRSDRLKPSPDAALARFHLLPKMRIERLETCRALEERKQIDGAKGILVRARGFGKEAACALLRKAAMDQGGKLAEVAAAP